MFKRILLAIALIIPMSGFAQKFGVVDLQSVFEAMPESATMRSQIEESSKKYEADFQQLRDELDKLYAEFQTLSNDPNTPKPIMERRASDIQERQQKVEQFRVTAQQDLNRLQEQLIAPIQQKMMEAVKAVGVEGQYTFIYANEPSLLLYFGTEVVNLTDAVKAKLNIAAPAK